MSNKFINKDLINIVFSFGFKIIGAVLGFTISVVLARQLGASGIGVYNLSISITALSIVITKFGLDNALLRFIAEGYSNKNWAGIKGLHNQSLRISITIGLVATVLIILNAGWISKFIFGNIALETPLRIMSLVILPNALINLYSEIYKGLGKVKLATFLQGACIPIVNILLLLSLYNNITVTLAILTYLSANLIVIFTLWLGWIRITYHAKGIKGVFDREKLVRTSFPLLWVSSMSLIIDTMDTIMIGLLSTSEEVGIYSSAAKIAFMSSMLLYAVNGVIGPKFSVFYSKGELKKLQSLSRKITGLTAMISILIVTILFIFRNEIMLLFGDEFILGTTAFSFLILGQFFALATGPVGSLLIMSGNEKYYKRNVMMCALMNLILNIILIPILGMNGAAISTAISLSAKNILSVIFVKKNLGFWMLPSLR
ncbi:flippase [Alkalihalobacillus sp. FSL W8-0930]